MKSPGILAIIPARRGSKRIPGKNSKNFCGKPLVQWTIEAALAVKEISKIVVSTDDPEILKMQSQFPGVTFSSRPPELCKDDVPGVDPVLYEMEKSEKYDYVLLLQPTSPLRNENHIREALEFCFIGNFSQLIGVRKPADNPAFIVAQQNEKLLPPAKDQKLWVINGAIYISKWQTLLEHKSFFTAHTVPFEMDQKVSIDIDTPEDWARAESAFKELK